MRQRHKELTDEQILTIAKNHGFFSTNNTQVGYQGRILKACMRLHKRGSLGKPRKHGNTLSFKFISLQGCPKAAQRFANDNLERKRFTTRKGVLSMLEKRGSLSAYKAPRSKKHQAFSDHCKNLLTEGLVKISTETAEKITYVKA